MKILVVLNTHVDSHSVSGVMKLFALLAKGWIERGHEVDFLTGKAVFPALRPLVPNAGLVSSDSIFDLTKHVDKTWLYFLPYAWRMLTAHTVRLPKRYDVVYASGHLIFEVYPATVIARRLGARLAIKVPHVLAAQSNRRTFFDRLFLATEKWSARLALKNKAKISALTDLVAADYRKLEAEAGVASSPIESIGCGLDLEHLIALPPRPRVHEVVFLARMHEKKGVFELPEVWKRIVQKHPQARLMVIGEGPHRRRTAEMFKALGLEETVRFTGAIPEDEKNRLLLEAKVGLSLSYEEGWGLSVTEFLAAGLPVVAYQLPVFESVFQGHLVLTRPGDVETAATEVGRLLQDTDLRQSLGERGKEFIKRYDYRAVADKEIRFLNS